MGFGDRKNMHEQGILPWIKWDILTHWSVHQRTEHF